MKCPWTTAADASVGLLVIPLFLIPMCEYGFGVASNASGSPRQTTWKDGLQRLVKLEQVGSSQREHRVGARVNQHVPVLV